MSHHEPLVVEALEERRLLSASSNDPLVTPLVLAGQGEFQVNTTTFMSQQDARIAKFADGSFAISWKTGGSSFLQRYDASGAKLGAEIAVQSSGTDVAVSATGESTIIVVQGFVYGARHSASGARIGDYFTVSATGGATSGRVLVDAEGNSTFVWRGSTANANAIYFRRYDAQGNSLGAQTLVGETTGSFDAEMNPAGDLVVGFGAATGPAKAVLIKADGNVIGEIQFPLAIAPSQAVNANFAAVAISDAGDFAVRYGTNGRTVQRYDAAGIARGAAFDIGLTLSHVEMSLEPGGGLVVTGDRSGSGYETGGSGLAVVARRFDSAGAAQGNWFLVNSYVTNDQQRPAIAALSGSDFLVAWDSLGQDAAGGYGVFAQRFSDDDLPIVETVAPPWGTPIVSGSELFSQLPSLRVTFSRSMVAADVTSPANWQLLEDGVDVSGLIAGITYSSGFSVLSFSEPLRGDHYELIASDAIHDTLGRALDGDRNGAAGGAFSIEFSIQQNVIGLGPEILVDSTDRYWSPLAINEQGGFTVLHAAGSWQSQPNSYVHVYDPSGRVPNLGYSLGSVSVSSVTPLEDDQYLGLLPAYSTFAVKRFDSASELETTAFLMGQSPFINNGKFARDGDGNFVVTWSVQNSMTDVDVVAQRFNAQGNPLGAAFPVNTPAPGLQSGATIAMSESGEFVIAWTNWDLSQVGYSVHARRFAADGTPLGAEILVASDPVSRPSAMEIARDAAGNLTFLWAAYSTGPTAGNIYLRRFTADGTALGDPVRVNTNSAQMFQPSFGVDASGRALVAWTEGDDVVARVYAPGGLPQGGQFQISVAPADNDGYVHVAMNSLGDAVVGWTMELASSLVDLRIQRLSLGHPPQLDLNGGAAGIDFQAEAQLDGNAVAIVDASSLFISDAPDDEFVGGAVTIVGALAGDLLSANTTGTSILAAYAGGELTLSGVDSLEHYQQVLRTLTFAGTADRPGGSTVDIQFVVDDGLAASPVATAHVEVYVPGSGSVAGRHIYYNNSKFDQPNPAGEDAAIAANKSAYLPGDGLATFSSVTSYAQGINGIMVDLGGLHGVPTLDDFSFKVGNSNDLSAWASAPLPSALTIRGDAGLAGADRIEITWPSGVIKNTWLEVTVAANARTGLAAPDVFYFGNKVGDSGTSPGASTFDTTSTDAAQVFATIGSNKLITDSHDYNRDGLVTSTDAAIVFANIGSLVRINLPGPLQPLVAVPQSGDMRIDSTRIAATPLNSSSENSSMPGLADGITPELAIRTASTIAPSPPGATVVTLPRTEENAARLDERAVKLARADENAIDLDHDELPQDTDDWRGARSLARLTRFLAPRWR